MLLEVASNARGPTGGAPEWRSMIELTESSEGVRRKSPLSTKSGGSASMG